MTFLDTPFSCCPTRLHEQAKQAACDAKRVAVFIPARNIETWLAYLDGQVVNENDAYPRLERERDCQHHVRRLYEMCQQGVLRQPAPQSLAAACVEYRARPQA
jgi:hypothetical protein